MLAICFESNARSCRLFAKMGFERSDCPPHQFSRLHALYRRNLYCVVFLFLINSHRWGLLPECVVIAAKAESVVILGRKLNVQ